MTNRREFLRNTTLGVSLALLDRNVVAQVPADAHSGVGRAVRGVHVGTPIPVMHNSGDTWVTTLGDDGNLYTPSNDTGGFHSEGLVLSLLPELTADQKKRIVNEDPTVSSELTKEQTERLERDGPGGPIAFNRVFGSAPNSLDGVTVNWMKDFAKQDRGVREVMDHFGKKMAVAADGCTWKSSGCTFVDGSLYWVIARHKYGEISGDPHLRQTAANASLIKSVDYGKTWIRSAEENLGAPMFPGAHFAAPYFIDYGGQRPATDGADQYIYAISNNGFWDNGDRLVLGRVRRDRLALLKGDDWEFLADADGSRSTAWTANSAQAKPILAATGHFGMSGVNYLPSRGRYMMVGWYYPAGGGKLKGAHTKTVWDFYESPKPWGPWTKIGSHTWSPQGYYCPCICQLFQSSDRVHVIAAGDWTNSKVYRLTVVPIDLA